MGESRWEIEVAMLGTEAAKKLALEGWEPVGVYYVPVNEVGYGGFVNVLFRRLVTNEASDG
jgi:hypothetical protein